MLSRISSVKTQRTTPQTKKYGVIRYYSPSTTQSVSCHLYYLYSLLAMVYARAPPVFQVRCLSFIPPLIASSLPYGFSLTPFPPFPATFVLSLNPDVKFSYNVSICPISPSNSKLTPLPLFDRYIHSNFIKSQSYSFLRRTRVLVYPEIIW